jgi:hypothetical protein
VSVSSVFNCFGRTVNQWTIVTRKYQQLVRAHHKLLHNLGQYVGGGQMSFLASAPFPEMHQRIVIPLRTVGVSLSQNCLHEVEGMKLLLKAAPLLIVCVATAIAQTSPSAGTSPAAGTWKGTVTPAPVYLPFILNIVVSGSTLAGTTQSPNQNPGAYALDSIAVSGNTLTFQQAQFGVTFRGTIQGNVLSGTMTQAGKTLPLELIHAQPSGCATSTLAGTWKGTFIPASPDVPIVLTISDSQGNLSATTQFPSQSSNSFPVDAVSLNGQTLTFRQAQFNVFFSGALSVRTITGTMTQNGFQLPVTFTKQ